MLQRRRELGIRITLGPQGRHVVADVTLATFAVVALGAAIGLGALSVRWIQSMLYRVSVADPAVLLVPAWVIAATAIGAAAPAVVRARRIDPVEMLRAG